MLRALGQREWEAFGVMDCLHLRTRKLPLLLNGQSYHVQIPLVALSP